MAKIIKLLFKPDKRLAVIQGTTTTTIRRYPAGKVGDYFIVSQSKGYHQDPDLYYYQLSEIKPMTLETAFRYHYKDNGFNSPEDALNYWITILYPNSTYRPDLRIYLHRFIPVQEIRIESEEHNGTIV